MKTTTTTEQNPVFKFQKADGSTRIAMLFSLLNNVSIREKTRIDQAWEFLTSVSEADRNAVYPGPVKTFDAFLLTRQIIALDLLASQGIVDRLLSEDPELIRKCALTGRKEILSFVEYLIGRCDHRRSMKLYEHARSRLVKEK